MTFTGLVGEAMETRTFPIIAFNWYGAHSSPLQFLLFYLVLEGVAQNIYYLRFELLHIDTFYTKFSTLVHFMESDIILNSENSESLRDKK